MVSLTPLVNSPLLSLSTQVSEQLAVYQSTLKGKSKQLKAMASELNMYQGSDLHSLSSLPSSSPHSPPLFLTSLFFSPFSSSPHFPPYPHLPSLVTPSLLSTAVRYNIQFLQILDPVLSTIPFLWLITANKLLSPPLVVYFHPSLCT